MSERLALPQTGRESINNPTEIVPASPEETEKQHLQTNSERAETEAAHTEAVSLALKEVHETQDAGALDSLIEGIDFSNGNKYSFSAMEKYAAEAGHIDTPTRMEGQLGKPGRYAYGKDWGDPYNEAHNKAMVVEKAGIRSATRQIGQTEELVPRKGLRGKLGFKQKVSKPKYEEFYVFDYTFNTPSLHGLEEALRAGNYAGQCINLSVELNKDQAEELSSILSDNPKAARQVLDSFVRETGDYGAWNAELYDEKGDFHNPVGRYGQDFVVRDVRPNYDAVPELEPELVGLIGRDKESEIDKLLPAA